jgi:poly(hydroxyalkanoate) granule-associated protein
MATRKKTETTPGLKGAAQEIWLAGLGAFNLAGEEGGKLFKQLVKRGREQKEANQEMMGNLKERAQTFKEDAREVLNKVTSPIEDGLASAMQRLGVPTRAEIVKLTHRVEELTKHVAKAKAAPAPRAQAAPAPRAKAASTAKPKPKAKARKQEKAAPAVTV